MKIRPDRIYLIVAAIVPFWGDIGVTLFAQTDVYWSGKFEAYNEANHIAQTLLSTHPGIFILGALVYAIFFSSLIYALPRAIAWWLSIGLLLAHIGGIKSWLPLLMSWKYYDFYEMGLNGIAATLACICYLKAGKTSNQRLEQTRDNAG